MIRKQYMENRKGGKRCTIWRLIFCFGGVVVLMSGMIACSRPVPLNKKKFAALMLDMHMADGILANAHEYRLHEGENYMYYNAVFERYGITRSDFDSCVRYYSGKVKYFERMYSVVVDTLEQRASRLESILSELTKDDAVNVMKGYRLHVRDTLDWNELYFEGIVVDTLYAEMISQKWSLADTVRIDSLNPCPFVEVDQITPGMYEFKTQLKLDTLDSKRKSRIVSYFLSPDGKDTLKVRELPVRSFTSHTWQHYVADSLYNRLVIQFVLSDSTDNRAKKQTGKIWGTSVYRKYLTAKEVEQHKLMYRQQ